MAGTCTERFCTVLGTLARVDCPLGEKKIPHLIVKHLLVFDFILVPSSGWVGNCCFRVDCYAYKPWQLLYVAWQCVNSSGGGGVQVQILNYFFFP